MRSDRCGDALRWAKDYRTLHTPKVGAKKDNAQMGVGLVLFWPALIFLEGGDGPEAAEYAQLKGNYEALQDNAILRKCGIYSKSPQQIIEEAHQDATREDEAG
mgnify:CR=1 FL=1